MNKDPLKQYDERRKKTEQRCKHTVDVMTHSGYLEDLLNWKFWTPQIPYIQFDPTWSIRIIPPFNGALVRFHVHDKEEHWVSVYLDCYDILGSIRMFGEPSPYWEVYPYDGDITRVDMNDVSGLLEAIRYALANPPKEEVDIEKETKAISGIINLDTEG